MVTARISRALLRLAVRWWPPHLREEMSAEWRAELYELAQRRRRLRMLRFAVSLTLTPPRLGPRRPLLADDASPAQAVRHLLLLLAVPVVFVVFGALPLVFGILVAALPTMVAGFVGSGSPLLRPWSIVVAVLAPSVSVLLLAPTMFPTLGRVWRVPTTTAAWAAVLAVTILVVSRRPTRSAVLVAAVGTIGAGALATVLAVMPYASMLGLDPAYAAMWYPADLAWPLKLPIGELPARECPEALAPCEMPPGWLLVDFTGGYPGALTMTAMFVMAYALGATREAAPAST